MRCVFCGSNTHGPWNYCDATCEQDHQTELDAQAVLGDEPESGDETTYDTLIDDDERDILDNMRRAEEAAADAEAEWLYENRAANAELTDAF